MPRMEGGEEEERLGKWIKSQFSRCIYIYIYIYNIHDLLCFAFVCPRNVTIERLEKVEYTQAVFPPVSFESDDMNTESITSKDWAHPI